MKPPDDSDYSTAIEGQLKPGRRNGLAKPDRVPAAVYGSGTRSRFSRCSARHLCDVEDGPIAAGFWTRPFVQPRRSSSVRRPRSK